MKDQGKTNLLMLGKLIKSQLRTESNSLNRHLKAFLPTQIGMWNKDCIYEMNYSMLLSSTGDKVDGTVEIRFFGLALGLRANSYYQRCKTNDGHTDR